MERLLVGARWSIFRESLYLLYLRRSSSTTQARFILVPTLSIRQYSPSPYTRRIASHAPTKHQDVTADLSGSDPPQVHPLSGYYDDILSFRSPYRRQATSSRPIPGRPDKPSPSSTVEPQSPQNKMSIVFGTPLAGPGRSPRSAQIPPESTWKTINGVAIPPRPEEPDNCCMSGCVHCVWDDFRDEMEEWAGRVEQAKVKGVSNGPTMDMRHTPRAEVDSSSTSIDDDGGGSETNWTAPTQADDLFASIPVGIREFMKTEKKLKQKHQ
ncbi:hypothetical protein BBP40_001150 [Aspergillus hancockii]|nr:hypothetical protein BBP40_001150 [Aspergillus hancockii]